MPRLSNLSLKAFGDNLLLFDADGFENIPVQIRAKVFLYLMETRSLSHRKLAMLVHPDQRRLDLSSCAAYVKDHYLAVLERTPDLNVFSVQGARLLTDPGFAYVARCSRLTDFNCSETQISSFAFSRIISENPYLVRLNVSHCKQLKRGLADAAKRCNNLSFVYANNCPNMEVEDLMNLMRLASRTLQVLEASDYSIGVTFEVTRSRYGASVMVEKPKVLVWNGVLLSEPMVCVCSRTCVYWCCVAFCLPL